MLKLLTFENKNLRARAATKETLGISSQLGFGLDFLLITNHSLLLC